ncbi:MAG: sigma-70 family RNA polymerase sigma factor [Bacteroidota bacterium]
MSEQQLIKKLQEGDELAFEKIYMNYRDTFIPWALKQLSGNEEEAKELYQVTMIALFENAVNGKLVELTSSLKTYIFAIGKNKIRELRRAKGKKINNIVDFALREDFPNVDDYEVFEENMTAVEQGLQNMDSKCSELLTRFYYKRQSMTEISDHMAYKNAKTTKNMKYKCLQRLRELVLKIMASSQKTI